MPIQVTVVDDSRLGRKMVLKALPAGWDAELTQACNGEEALAACRAGKGDVVFLDLNMPVMDGYQFLEALGQESSLNPTVFVVSADIQPIALERVKQLGAKAFLKKPVNSEEVAAVLCQHQLL